MIRLHQFRRAWGLPNPSPFCIKVELALRIAKLPYEIVEVDAPRGPKGKAPWIVDGAVTLGDSSLILDYLRTQYGFDPDAGLTPAQRAVSRAFLAMLDERSYWTGVYSRWIDPAQFPRTRAALFRTLPVPLQTVVGGLARARIRLQMWGHGMGRHSPAEIYDFGCRDIDALADFLGDGQYMHGDAGPTLLDIGVYAFCGSMLKAPYDTPLQARGRQHANLVQFVERMHAAWFPDL